MPQDDEFDIPGMKGTGRTRFSKTAWGLELWDLLVAAISLIYEPELQASPVGSESVRCAR